MEGILESLKGLFPLGDSITGEERRRAIRLSCRIPVRCRLDANEFQAVVTNIGPGGMRLESTRPLKKGQFVEIFLASRTTVREGIRCTVAWRRQSKTQESFGVGVSFSDTNERLATSWVREALQQLGFAEGKLRERRRLLRVPSDIRVAVANLNGDLICDGSLLDLSVGGIRCVLETPITPGSKIGLQIGPCGGMAILALNGTVLQHRKDVSRQKYTHRIQFYDVTEPQGKLVKKYLAVLAKASGR